MAVAAPPSADAPSESGDKKAGGGGDKKKGGKGSSSGVVLGKGTTVLRAAVEAAAAVSVSGAEGGSDSAVTLAVSPASASTEGSATPAGPVVCLSYGPALSAAAAAERAWRGCKGALDPLGTSCGKLIEEIKAVVEANQV